MDLYRLILLIVTVFGIPIVRHKVHTIGIFFQNKIVRIISHVNPNEKCKHLIKKFLERDIVKYSTKAWSFL